jgi:tRNA-specific 2-thiouridylase
MSAPVLVAMSGGVDSSVAAALLVEAGHDVTGVTLKLWGGDSNSGCCGVDDVEDARRVAAQLGIPHYVFNFADDFDTRVVTPYVDAYAGGRTPNPCVECNRTMKFGRLLERAGSMGFERVATGHHARVQRTPDDRFRLLRGRDREKDQSYVLYMLTQRQLARVSLPVGEFTKPEVRAHAARLGLRTADKPESMDVCFIARTDTREQFVGARIPARPGPVVDATGSVVGHHHGVAAFTVGQRRGLGIATGERRYVLDVDASTATVTIGRRDQLLRDEVRLEGLSFVDELPDGRPLVAQVRAHGAPVAARLHGDRLQFAQPQPRVAPGQVVALYDGDAMLGGGLAA